MPRSMYVIIVETNLQQDEKIKTIKKKAKEKYFKIVFEK